ncbi:unnamed protein product [Diamesa serratosioi]
MKKVLGIIIVIIVLFESSCCFPDGAPESQCQAMTPNHGYPPQQTKSPFVVEPDANIVGQGQILQIKIISSSLLHNDFKGFMIQARTVTNQIVGQFKVDENELVIARNCGTENSTATHSSFVLKSIMILEWKAPEDFVGKVNFHATVVESFTTFWINVNSVDVEIVPVKEAPITTTPQATVTTTTTTTVQPIDDANNVYNGCSETKTCFGLPNGCLLTKNCISLGAVIYEKDSRFIFEMISSNRAAFIAMGLSTDRLMGDDLAIECVNEGASGIVKAYVSLTFKGNEIAGSNRSKVNQNIINLLESRYEDGRVYCRVELDNFYVVDGNRFDLVNEKYYLLLVSGTSLRIGSVGFHDINFEPSAESLKLTEVSEVKGRTRTWYKIHGCLMVFAWIGTSTVGIIVARYFKKTWVGSQMFGKELWFVAHQFCMGTTVILSIIAFTIIFIDVGEYLTNYHALLGTATFAFCLLQPIAGLLRPSPSHRFRKYFNIAHFTFGNVTHLMAFVTIILAVTSLKRPELPEWTIYILIASFVVYIVLHIVLTVRYETGLKLNNIILDNADKISHKLSKAFQTTRDSGMDGPLSYLRKSLLYFFAFVFLMFVISLIVVIALSPLAH